jgi:hypothetical protein
MSFGCPSLASERGGQASRDICPVPRGAGFAAVEARCGSGRLRKHEPTPVIVSNQVPPRGNQWHRATCCAMAIFEWAAMAPTTIKNPSRTMDPCCTFAACCPRDRTGYSHRERECRGRPRYGFHFCTAADQWTYRRFRPYVRSSRRSPRGAQCDTFNRRGDSFRRRFDELRSQHQ